MCNATTAVKARPRTFTRPIKVRLTAYDWIVVNTSAGKDSQAMLDEVCRQAREAGVLDRVVAIHSDLGRVEWAGTKELAEEQARHYGVRFVVVRRTQGDLLQHVLDRAAKLRQQGKRASPWPSSTARYCTSDHKRGPVAVALTRLSRERKPLAGGRVRILNCMGIRAAESPARSKKLPFRLDRHQTNGRKVVHVWLPIFGWSVAQVWDRIRASGAPAHPAYALGMPRLSCCFCIFAPRSALVLAGKHNRALLDEYVRVEEQVGSRFRVGLPIAEIRNALDRGEEPGPVASWQM